MRTFDITPSEVGIIVLHRESADFTIICWSDVRTMLWDQEADEAYRRPRIGARVTAARKRRRRRQDMDFG